MNQKSASETSTATAILAGGNGYPDICGTAILQQIENGVLITVNVSGLPHASADTNCNGRFFALHIHDGTECTGTAEDEFADAGSHYNPYGCLHPQHAGDLPPLLGCDGRAYCSLLTNRFTLNDVIGKAIIIHEQPDDFMTQPSGNSGKKIACGIIQMY